MFKFTGYLKLNNQELLNITTKEVFLLKDIRGLTTINFT